MFPDFVVNLTRYGYGTGSADQMTKDEMTKGEQSSPVA